jgi:hypothetical protein
MTSQSQALRHIFFANTDVKKDPEVMRSPVRWTALAFWAAV